MTLRQPITHRYHDWMRRIAIGLYIGLFLTGCATPNNTIRSGNDTPPEPSLPGTQLPSPATSIKQLNALELAVIDQQNLLRANPPEYARRFLAPLVSRYRGNYLYDTELTPGIDRVITEEGVAALQEAIAELNQRSPLPTMQPSRALTLSAEDHARDQVSGRTGHIGSDGSTLLTRIKRRGRNLHAVAENIAYGQATARRIINALLIDDGVKDRGHRETLLNPRYRYIGVATMPHKQYGVVTVLHYADQIDAR